MSEPRFTFTEDELNTFAATTTRLSVTEVYIINEKRRLGAGVVMPHLSKMQTEADEMVMQLAEMRLRAEDRALAEQPKA